MILALFAWHSARFVWFDYQDGVTAFASVPAQERWDIIAYIKSLQ